MTAIRDDIDDFDVWYKYNVDGWTYQEISDYYGVSRGCIYYRLYPKKLKEYNDKKNQSAEGKAAKKEWQQSDNGKAAIIRYWQSDKGKITKRKHRSERRGLGSIELNKPFPNSEGHHIDEEHIIHIPKSKHRSILHNVHTGEGMEEINTIAFQYITEDTFDRLLAGEI